ILRAVRSNTLSIININLIFINQSDCIRKQVVAAIMTRQFVPENACKIKP
ncbi:MAG: hypothetical protein ACD_74C00179G0001, partial [uncultured bacterium]